VHKGLVVGLAVAEVAEHALDGQVARRLVGDHVVVELRRVVARVVGLVRAVAGAEDDIVAPVVVAEHARVPDVRRRAEGGAVGEEEVAERVPPGARRGVGLEDGDLLAADGHVPVVPALVLRGVRRPQAVRLLERLGRPGRQALARHVRPGAAGVGRGPDPPVAAAAARIPLLDEIVGAVHVERAVEDVHVGVRHARVRHQRVRGGGQQRREHHESAMRHHRF